jgi:hypothetical protein
MSAAHWSDAPRGARRRDRLTNQLAVEQGISKWRARRRLIETGSAPSSDEVRFIYHDGINRLPKIEEIVLSPLSVSASQTKIDR